MANTEQFNTLFQGFNALVPIYITEIFWLDKIDGEKVKNDQGVDKGPHDIQIHEDAVAAADFAAAYNEMVKGNHESRAYVARQMNMSLRDIMMKCHVCELGKLKYYSFR